METNNREISNFLRIQKNEKKQIIFVLGEYNKISDH